MKMQSEIYTKYIRIPHDMHKELKLIAFSEGTSIQAVATVAVREYLQRRNRTSQNDCAA